MTSTLSSFALYKNVNISKTKKDIQKWKMPFFFNLKSLSNMQQLLFFLYRHLKVAQNSFHHIPRLRFWCIIITTLYQLMLQAWYQKTAQSLVNTLVLFLWHNRLPQQHYDLLKTPLILAVSAYNSKTSSVTPIFYSRIVISMIRCNFLQSL